tara:strand:+ start:1279 stop:1554 length:276 start_codon:yes stop_codon:yes gene_type:complete
MENNQCKITDDEKNELVELNAEYQNLLLSMGELNVEELSLKTQLKSLKQTKKKYKESLIQFKNKEKIFSDRLTKKYGAGDLDISSGIYLKS